MDDPSHIFLATPCYGGMVTQIYMQSVLALMTETAGSNVAVSIALLGQDALITRSRNTLVAHFLKSQATHLLFIDADIGFNSKDVLRLLQSRMDVAGSLYPIRAHHWSSASIDRIRAGETAASAGLEYVGEPIEAPNQDGFARARYAGTGFLMISRSALTTMTEHYPETRCSHRHVAGSPPLDNVFALFDCMIEPQPRHYLSEDYAFCWRWRALNGEIWLDTRAELVHAGMSEFKGDPSLRTAGA